MSVRIQGAVWRLAVTCALTISSVSSVNAQSATERSFLTIHGKPATAVTAGERYEFRPAAMVLSPNRARFEIRNRAQWMVFDVFTGRLSGAPFDIHAGKYQGIQISVTDGITRATLPAFSITVRPEPRAGAVTLDWTAPTENEDGSALTNLAGYRIYSGPSPEELKLRASVANGGLSRYVVEPVAPGRHWFSITAVNSSGIESELGESASALVE